MVRGIARLQQRVYDVVIVGGGIYGACAAWDAALRGLSVALVEKGDFAHATSGNNHKIIHGGFRYLQHGDLKRMRESIRERRILMRIASHLVSPLPCLLPTYRGVRRGKSVLWAGLKLNDLIGFDRNRRMESRKLIPGGRILSKDECLRMCPGLNQSDITAGALFHDAQVSSPSRLTLSFLLSAARVGADVVNYAQVTGFLRRRNAVTGVQVRDLMSETSFPVYAKVVVNCGGPWIDHVLQLTGAPCRTRKHQFLKAAVLMTRPLVQGTALGVLSKPKGEGGRGEPNRPSRYLFITPWRDKSLIGTLETPYDGDPDDVQVCEHEIQDFLNEVNAAYPAELKRHEVYFIYSGLIPREEAPGTAGTAQAARHYRIYDHGGVEGLDGLISVLGVKFTTARNVAQKAIDLVSSRLGKGQVRCRTDVTPLQGGAIERLEEFAALEVRKKSAGLSTETLHHLLRTYGSDYRVILRYGEEDSGWCQPVTHDTNVLRAEVLHGIREEMAQRLTDVLLRRTELGTEGYPGDACLKACAEIMARELRWDKRMVVRELEHAEAAFAARE